jgi:hypothetical protein
MTLQEQLEKAFAAWDKGAANSDIAKRAWDKAKSDKVKAKANWDIAKAEIIRIEKLIKEQ